MLASLFLLLPNWLLQAMIENALIREHSGDPEVWRKKLYGVAEDWIFSLIASAALIAAAMLIVKILLKKLAKGDPRKEIWTLPKTLLFIFIGLLLAIRKFE